MNRRRKIAIIAGSVGLVAAGGGAYAYWSTNGSGSGNATAATTAAVTLSPGTPTAALYPASTANVVLSVSNPNSARVHISTLALDTTQGTSGFAVDAGHSSCSVVGNANVLWVADQTNGGVGWTVPGKVGSTNGSLAITLANAIQMRGVAANACQGATFTVYLAAS